MNIENESSAPGPKGTPAGPPGSPPGPAQGTPPMQQGQPQRSGGPGLIPIPAQQGSAKPAVRPPGSTSPMNSGAPAAMKPPPPKPPTGGAPPPRPSPTQGTGGFEQARQPSQAAVLDPNRPLPMAESAGPAGVGGRSADPGLWWRRRVGRHTIGGARAGDRATPDRGSGRRRDRACGHRIRPRTQWRHARDGRRGSGDQPCGDRFISAMPFVGSGIAEVGNDSENPSRG